MSGAIIQYHDQFVMRVLHQQFMILHPIWFIQKQIWSFGRYFLSQHSWYLFSMLALLKVVTHSAIWAI